MPYLRTILLAFCLLYFAALASAEDKSFYSPVIQVDKDNHRVLNFDAWLRVLYRGAGGRPATHGQTSRLRPGRFRRRDARQRSTAPDQDLEGEIRRVDLHVFQRKRVQIAERARLYLTRNSPTYHRRAVD